jgi:hypothetical protein
LTDTIAVGWWVRGAPAARRFWKVRGSAGTL